MINFLFPLVDFIEFHSERKMRSQARIIKDITDDELLELKEFLAIDDFNLSGIYVKNATFDYLQI